MLCYYHIDEWKCKGQKNELLSRYQSFGITCMKRRQYEHYSIIRFQESLEICEEMEETSSDKGRNLTALLKDLTNRMCKSKVGRDDEMEIDCNMF